MARSNESEARRGPGVGFGAALRHRRELAGMSQGQLAERAGMSAKAISALERGERRRPYPHTVDLLATSLGLDAEQRRALVAAARGGPSCETPALPPCEAFAGPGDAAPGGDAGRHNLPIQPTSFIGRERELAELTDRLADGPRRSRLLTLAGTGGCGKTRLALRVAGALGPSFPDGVWLVDLAPIADPALVPGAIARAVGVREGPERPIEVALPAALRRKSLLLLLDNCEHLIPACARVADALLRAGPGVCILATSREPLGIAGEETWRVPPLRLPTPDEAESPAAFAACDAVRLLVERAAAVRPGFRLTDRTAPVAARICERLDGLPLAIELAATRARALSLEQIAARLDDRFRLLTGGSRTALPRQQTLAATVDWSYDLLTAPERALFNRLAVFAGGFTLDAAEAVCGDDGPDVLDLLVGLVDKSLVVAEGDAGGVRRYRLPETLRQYGWERLVASGEADPTRRRHAAYYRALAEGAEPHLRGPDQLIDLARLDREVDNLRAALGWCRDGGDAEAGLRLGQALSFFWWYRGRVAEGRGWLLGFLRLPGPAGAGAARANALTWAGVFTFVQGEEAAGRALIAEARTTARAVGDGRAIAWATLMLAIAERSTLPTPGLEVPRRLAEEALALYREDGDRSGIAKSLMVLAGFAQAMGDLGEARRFARESLTTARAAGDRWVIAQALEVLGDLTGAEDDATARVLLVECRALYGEMGEIPGLASVEIRLGRLECRHGRYARAREHYRASLRSSRQSGWIDRTLRSLGGLATVAAGLGQLECAVRLGAACANLVDTTGVRLPPNEQADLDRAVASAERAMGEKGRAEAWAAEPAMTLEQAIAYALRQDCRAHDGATHPS